MRCKGGCLGLIGAGSPKLVSFGENAFRHDDLMTVIFSPVVRNSAHASDLPSSSSSWEDQESLRLAQDRAMAIR